MTLAEAEAYIRRTYGAYDLVRYITAYIPYKGKEVVLVHGMLQYKEIGKMRGRFIPIRHKMLEEEDGNWEVLWKPVYPCSYLGKPSMKMPDDWVYTSTPIEDWKYNTDEYEYPRPDKPFTGRRMFDGLK